MQYVRSSYPSRHHFSNLASKYTFCVYFSSFRRRKHKLRGSVVKEAGMQAHPQSFDLSKIRANPVKLGKIWKCS